jgi:hypothetical protein
MAGKKKGKTPSQLVAIKDKIIASKRHLVNPLIEDIDFDEDFDINSVKSIHTLNALYRICSYGFSQLHALNEGGYERLEACISDIVDDICTMDL